MLERLFTLAFKRLVYPQIWEDPVVDMKALDIGPGHEVIAIASGGCNVLSYLTADPAGVTAVDLNGAHIALGRLKICAAQNLPDYDSFFRFFGRADARANVAAYDRRLRAKLDPTARAYWDKRTTFGRRRIGLFARNFYRHGLLGHVLGAGHTLARAQGQDARRAARALRETPGPDLSQTARPLALEAARIPLRVGHSTGPIPGSGRRFPFGNRSRLK
jgi:S-adenosylmethionine-diacylglycerol 3-amino-3-carboxypropyl transferase